MDKVALMQEYIELKEEEKVRKKRLDEINKFFKSEWVDDTIVDGKKLEFIIKKTAKLTSDFDTIEQLKQEYPEFLELSKAFLDYAKNQPQLHQYIEYSESVSLNIKKANNDNNNFGATSSIRDELF